MFEILTKTDPVEQMGETLLRTAEGLLNCRRMADYHQLVEDCASFEVDPAYKPLWASRFMDVFDCLTDMTLHGNDFDDWNEGMQNMDAEVAKLRGRAVKVPWNHRDD